MPSLLDKLLDDDPKTSFDRSDALAFDLARYKKSVARDLEALLNSRCPDVDGSIDSSPYARNSMLNFGIIDLSSLSLLNPDDRALLRDKIRITIERHEPRLHKVAATLQPRKGAINRVDFVITAELKSTPAAEPMQFNAVFQPSLQRYSIQRVRGTVQAT